MESLENSSPRQNIKFILDRTKKEQEELIAKIFEVVKKKPYPDYRTKHLARFIHALFQTAPYVKHPHLKKEDAKHKEKVTEKEELKLPSLKPLPQAPKVHRLQPEPVMPETSIQQPIPSKVEENTELKVPVLNEELKVPSLGSEELKVPSLDNELVVPELDKPKREYVVMLFNTPIGIYVAPDEKTYKLTYHVIEPVIDENVLKLTKEMIKKDFKKDYKIIDNEEYLKEKVLKACKKLNITFTEDYPRKIRYYLKRDLAGFRRIDPLLQDTNVKAIYVDGINKPVIVDFGENEEKIETNVMFTDPEDLNVLIKKLAKLTGTELNEQKPIMNTIFQGFRIQATLGIGGTTSKLIIKKVMF
jgi:hypothetical protein